MSIWRWAAQLSALFTLTDMFNFITSNFKKHSLWILNTILDLLKEQHSILPIQQTMIVRQCQIHHWSGNYLVPTYDWSIVDCMHTEDGRLWWVDDWGSHEGAESATVGNRECSTVDVFKSKLSLFSLFGKLSQLLKLAISLPIRFRAFWGFDSFSRLGP